MSLSGPFQNGGKGRAPELDMTATVKGTASGEDVDFEGGFVLLPNSAYVNYQGTNYEVDPTTYSFVESTLKQAQKQSGVEEESATACQEALPKWISGTSSTTSATTAVRTWRARARPRSAATSMSEARSTPWSNSPKTQPAVASFDALEGQLDELPSGSDVDEASAEVEDAVKAAHADIYVGEDNIIRRFSAQLDLELKGDEGGTENVDLNIDMTLGGVNEDQEISAPSDEASQRPLPGAGCQSD